MEHLPIETYAYQLRAGNIIESFLKTFWRKEKKPLSFHSLSFEHPESEKITVRVKEKPPSLQLIHYPEGGVRAGTQRIDEKLFEPFSKLVIVEEKDLTRETIIVTLEDATTDEILEHGLLTPEQIASLLQSTQELQPKLFIAIDRFLMGFEKRDGQKIPFHLIEQDDEKTWGYVETLSEQLTISP